MKVCVVGLGYVGMANALFMASKGHEVVGVDDNEALIDYLKVHKSHPEIVEPAFDELLGSNLPIKFASSEETKPSEFNLVLICVGTMASGNSVGSVFYPIASTIAWIKDRTTIFERPAIVIRSTIDAEYVERTQSFGNEAITIVPEFLQEGRAWEDFNNPKRVVVGSPTGDRNGVPAAANEFINLIANGAPVVTCNYASAILAKVAANAMLATRVAQINEFAKASDEIGACFDDVAKILGMDPRIGSHYMRPGVGFGGSCLPKDTRGLAYLLGTDSVTAAALNSNDDHLTFLKKTIFDHFKDGAYPFGDQKTVTVWGLGFKAGTTDVRQSQAMKILDALASKNILIHIYDHEGIDPESYRFVEVKRFKDRLASLEGSDALITLTDEPDNLEFDLASATLFMRRKLILDFTNSLDAKWARELGYDYRGFGNYSVGRT